MLMLWDLFSIKYGNKTVYHSYVHNMTLIGLLILKVIC